MNRDDKNQDHAYLRLLQQEVWKKAIGNEFITKGNHYYEKISAAIYQQTGTSISKDTIRNFLEERHTPSSKTLNIYSTFVLGDRENKFTFLDFKAYARQHKLSVTRPEPENVPRSFKRYWLAGLLLFSLGCSSAYLTGRWWNPPVQFQTYAATNPELSSKVAIMERLPLNQKDFDLFMNGFEFDSTTQVNVKEGKRIIEWFGIKEYIFADLAQPVYEGTLPNGCKLSVSIGALNKGNFYGVLWSCKYIDPEYPNIYVRYEKPQKTIPFYERFYHSDLSLLQQNSWFLFNDSMDVELWNNSKYKELYSKRLFSGYSPKYIGLTAFQGRPDIPTPVYPVADVIPAHFEYVRIKDCKND